MFFRFECGFHFKKQNKIQIENCDKHMFLKTVLGFGILPLRKKIYIHLKVIYINLQRISADFEANLPF